IFGSGTAKTPYALDDADTWSYIAPLANLLAGWWLLSDRQNDRFVTGIASIAIEKLDAPHVHQFRYRYQTEVALRPFIAKDHYDDFETFTGVPVVATVSTANIAARGKPVAARVEALTATVEEGTLKVSFTIVLPAKGLKKPPPLTGGVDFA